MKLISQHNSQALRNPWVLGLLTFLVVFLSANAVFIYLAFSDRPNLVVDNYYERGKEYQKRLAVEEQQAALGWTGNLILPGTTRVNQPAVFEAQILGENARSVDLDSVRIFAYRPSDMNKDFDAGMQSVGSGRYEAELTFKYPGNWDLIVEAKRGEDEYLITRRIYIDP